MIREKKLTETKKNERGRGGGASVHHRGELSANIEGSKRYFTDILTNFKSFQTCKRGRGRRGERTLGGGMPVTFQSAGRLPALNGMKRTSVSHQEVGSPIKTKRNKKEQATEGRAHRNEGNTIDTRVAQKRLPAVNVLLNEPTGGREQRGGGTNSAKNHRRREYISEVRRSGPSANREVENLNGKGKREKGGGGGGKGGATVYPWLSGRWSIPVSHPTVEKIWSTADVEVKVGTRGADQGEVPVTPAVSASQGKGASQAKGGADRGGG